MKIGRIILRLGVLGACSALLIGSAVYLYLSPNLPSVEVLRDIKLQTPMRVYTREGDLIGQFGEQKRNPLPFEQIPEPFVQALLAAEDDGFFDHAGIDLMGLLRAVSELVLTGEKGSGGSTLTMQVARNYFLTLERTFTRKFKEILLSLEIERALSKQEIFELYFNQVFLGHRAYGFEAAAQVYYGKNIGDLDLAQLAMLAGLPKAPSRYNPISNPQRSQVRRNWILGRMELLNYISTQQYQLALSQPVTARHHGAKLSFSAPYAAEMARREMIQRYGLAAYSDGYHVFTSISSSLQLTAREAVIAGLDNYDQRHGYRGPELSLPRPEEDLVSSPQDNPAGTSAEPVTIDAAAQVLASAEPETPATALEPLPVWVETLSSTPVIAGHEPAIVTGVEDLGYHLLMDQALSVFLDWESGPAQARPFISENARGAVYPSPQEFLKVGDLIRVKRDENGELRLSQLPAAQAALISMSPENGAILAMVGGLGFQQSKFNRVTQAARQPGSNFKPFIYAAAFEQAGITAATIINDAPVVFDDPKLEGRWAPENDGGRFYGPTRLRLALTKSRNLVSVRLLQQLGIQNAINYIERFGFNRKELPRDLSLALGSHAITPLQLATAYASLANGGYRVEPWLIERIEDFGRETVFEARPVTVCRDCLPEASSEESGVLEEINMEAVLARIEAGPPEFPPAPQIMDPRVAFLIDSILKDVITQGTGRRARVLERSDIAGKTGTTNGPKDAWFSGYNADVVTTTWLGFDQNLDIGKNEFGGSAALPIWIDYMRVALANSPDRPRPLPEGMVSARIDKSTGQLAKPGQGNVMFELFRAEHLPQYGQDSDGGKVLPSDSNEELQGELF